MRDTLGRLAYCGSFLAQVAAGPALADEPTLGGAADSSGRYFGAAVSAQSLGEPGYSELVRSQASSLTPENAMKWGFVEPERGRFDWAQADAVAKFAADNRQKLRGHALVWHKQLPTWLSEGAFSPSEIKKLMVAHIATEIGRYRGSIYAWDVVNEPLDKDGTLRKSVFYDAMGPAYVVIALEAARKADPRAKLYINEYDVETEGPKLRGFYDLVAGLKREGVPIDGVGLQAHFARGGVPSDLADVVAKFAALDLDVAITELDIRVPLPADAATLQRQAQDYAAVVAVCRSTPRCVGVTTWGIADNHSWVPSVFPGFGAALPFDAEYRPKPAVAAMIEAWRAPSP